ncbi:MAG: PAS domain S-box protein [Candidatus Bathyarchaeia archaeon]
MEEKEISELISVEKGWKNTFDALSDFLFILDKDFRFVRVNKAFCNAMKKEKAELIGTHCYKTLHGRDSPWPSCPYKRLLKTKKVTVEEINDPYLGIPLVVTTSPLLDDKDQVIGCVHLAQDISERNRREEEKDKVLHDYGERVKELKCLYGISKLIQETENLKEILEEVVDLLPPAWQFPEITCVRIMVDEQIFVTKYFKETRWKQTADIKVMEAKVGVVEVYYLKEMPDFDEGPFLKEERDLIIAVAEQLGRLIQRKQDLAERMKAEKKLKKSEEEYRRIVELAPDMILTLNTRGVITSCNIATLRMTGYSKEEIMGKNFTKIGFIKLIDIPKYMKLFISTLRGKETKPFEATWQSKDGIPRLTEVHVSLMKEDGKTIGIQAIARDITERKKAENALHESEERYRTLFESAREGIIITGPDGRITRMNDAGASMLGYNSPEELVGIPAVELYLDPKARKVLFEEILERGYVDHYELTIKKKDGSPIHTLNSSLIRRDEDGNILQIEAFFTDITERKKMEEKLEKLIQQLKSSNELLAQSNDDLENYTYVVSHDLKAPLRAIRSFSTFLLEDYSSNLDEAGQDYLDRMGNAAIHMDELIEDLLLLSRVGRKFIEIEKVDLDSLLSEIITDLAPAIKKRNAEVVVNKLPTISVQRTWIRQLFVNLIDNGLKFNKSDTPRVKVLCDVRTKDYLFSVRDNGIGIEDQYHERIFNLFEKLHSREEFDGTGAGLAISKKIVQNLGGRIWVESAPKEGSSFFFTIPRK